MAEMYFVKYSLINLPEKEYNYKRIQPLFSMCLCRIVRETIFDLKKESMYQLKKA